MTKNDPTHFQTSPWGSHFCPQLIITALYKCSITLKPISWASLVAQWLRIHLPMQGTWVWALVWEDPTCHGATKPVCHNYWACALEPASHNYWAHVPRTRAPQQENPPQWEARAPQRRVGPAHRNQRKACTQQRRPNAAKSKFFKKTNILFCLFIQNYVAYTSFYHFNILWAPY